MTMTVTDKGAVPRVGILGAGFMASVHAHAARAAGAALVGVTSLSAASAKRAADELGFARAFDSAEELIEAADVDTIHICSPNQTHAPFALAALQAGKHVVCEKPLAISLAEAQKLAKSAAAAQTLAVVPFIYRYHPMVREARARLANGRGGRVFSIHGAYLQDWLWSERDDNWRVDVAVGGPSRAFADIGSHLCDLIEFVTQSRIVRLAALTSTVHSDRVRNKAIATEDLAAIMFQTDAGAIGNLLVSQVAAGRKNRLVFEISGERESYLFDQENPDLLWVGGREGFTGVTRDPAVMEPSAASYSIVPPGHPMGYQDAFNAFMRDAYNAQQGEQPDGLPTFTDGLRAAELTEAVLTASSSGDWVSTPGPGHASNRVGVA